ncbi:gliding motility-associated C-terminal domain-containing protein, partial [Nonlabens xiamenensis]|uniref:gliding motility-associated C-terminal domain-containing protein n=1 Tax=Nonlabens xiamenensis TaxID=2341043 RepID=UPI0013DE20A8
SDVDLTLLTVGTYNYSYTITDGNGCTNTSTVPVTVQPAPESGNYVGTPFQVCEDQAAANSPYDLFNLLDGTQDTNGTWYVGADTTGATIMNPIDLATLGTGTFDFTYSVPPIGTCTDVDVTVQVIIDANVSAGVATNYEICDDLLAANSPLDLFGQLSGNDVGGTWTDDDATGALTGSDVDLTQLAVGSYGFTYTVTNGNCTDSVSLMVDILPAPDAGSASDFEICLTDIAPGQQLDLFNQLAGNDAGGTWSDDDATGTLTGSIVDLTALTAGSYDFTYSVSPSAACNADTATLSVIINDIAAPVAPASQEFCDAATVADLTATGNMIQWYADAGQNTLLTATDALMDGGDYFATQTDPVTGCESAMATQVSVVINTSSNAGNAVPLSVCNNNASVDLFTALDGTQDAGGSWIDTDGTGAVTGSNFNASTVAPGVYNFEYMVTGISPCPDASTVVQVNVEVPVTAGNDASVDLCSDNGTVDLFNSLGSADIGGTWSPALASGTGVFDPLIDTAGAYSYTVSSACNMDTATINVTVTQAPNAGMDNVISFCTSDATVDLLTQLGGTPDGNGTWSPMLASGTNIFDPSVDTAGLYTYTVSATGPCTTDDSATLDISIASTSEPMVVSNSLSFCVTDNAMVMDLDVAVTGTTIQWYDTATAQIPLDPTDDLVDGATYFATQTGANGCESATRVSVSVSVGDAPTPTLETGGNVFCINDQPSLLNLTQNIIEFDSTQDNVSWYDSISSTTVLDSSQLLVDGATYYAVLIDQATACESSQRLEVTVDLSGCGTVSIPDGFSPNGDGVNDVFDIDNIEFLYPNYELEFYNRYGNLVYEGSAGTPKFNGFSNQSALLSSGELPVGVYYYILKFNDGSTQPRQGRIYLSR